MTKKIIGVTVGTTMNPKTAFDKIGVAGSAPDWNENNETSLAYIKGRTHYVKEGVEITWDGNVEDLEKDYIATNDNGPTFFVYKVSDNVLSNDEIKGSKILMHSFKDGSFTQEFVYDMSNAEHQAILSPIYEENYVATNAFLVIKVDNCYMKQGMIDYTFPKKGIYFTGNEFAINGSVVSNYGYKMSVPGFVKQLDDKFLPTHEHSWNDLADKPFGETAGWGKKTLTFDGNPEEKTHIDIGGAGTSFLVKMSNDIPTATDFIGCEQVSKSTSDGNTSPLYVTEDSLSDGTVYMEFGADMLKSGSGYAIGSAIWVFKEDSVIAEQEQSGLPEIPISSGVWTIYLPFAYCSQVQYYGQTEVIKQLDAKYIPDTFATKEYVDSAQNFPEGGEAGQFLVSDGNGGATWLTIGMAEEDTY